MPLEPTPIGDKYLPYERREENRTTIPLDLYLCKKCGQLQTGAVVDPKQIYVHYLSRPVAVNPVLSDSYRDYAEDIISRYNPSPNSLIVEMGSNEGAFLRFFKNRGFPVLGIDPAENLAEAASESGIETIPAFFTSQLAEEIKSNHGDASIFIGNFVYANINNVIDATQGIRHLLAPHGVFMFETNYRLDIFQKDLIETINHEHLSYFSVSSLQAFFQRQEMELFHVERVPSKGGSLRCAVQLKGGDRLISPSVRELIELEDKLGICDLSFYESCADHINSTRSDLAPFLEDIILGGGTLAGYGTSIGATILIYQLGLGEKMSFLVDDDPYRQNLVSPGYHIPVMSPDIIYEQKPEYIAILAPLYAEAIMNKNRAFGGRFLTVWPKIEVHGDPK